MKKPRLSPEEYLASFKESGKNVIGTFISSPKGGGGSFIIPDDDKLPQSIDVKNITDRGQTVIAATVSGFKVVAQFVPDHTDKVNIIEVLGSANTVGTDILSIIREHKLYEEFPNEVVAEAKSVAKITAAEVARREDLRGKVLITIDPEDAQDLDDAVSLEKNNEGNYELGVHIADVSNYVAEGSQLDAEAFRRGTSVYFPGGVLPMLPVELSNDICSLNPNQDRLALSCFMTIDRSGRVLKSRISETVISTHTRFSYMQVQGILDGDAELCREHKKLIPMLNDCAELTKILEGIRQKRGEVILDVPEPKIILDPETGKIADVIAYPHLMAHRIIETFMIECNETIAEYALEHSLPFVYRIHDKPDPLKVAKLVDMLKPFSIMSTIKPEYPKGQDYQRVLKDLDKDLKPIISQLLLRSMQKAKYSPDCVGHFGLGSKYYCHFTSPIRRYPDLVIHRILKLMLNKKLSSHKIAELTTFVDSASDQATKTEITATEVERAVDDLKRAEYMNDHIGEPFSGTISGIMDFGCFVYLPNTVEGLVRVENMPKDGKEFYIYNEKTATMSSKARTFKMGDKIDVVCVGVNMARRQVEFAAAPKH
ncbi:MAG: ribonuclease R [Christensenellaceae bacterium]|jgi:ribonuclease R|nr:ribonuclease R [Christensenellaceae bacterium]